jgi:MinD-like ATPase involved in chromosome partitioning or flagellar assembly
MTTTQPTRIGKTTVATCVGLSFAQVRPGDLVVAINADTAFATLGARVDTAPRSP